MAEDRTGAGGSHLHL